MPTNVTYEFSIAEQEYNKAQTTDQKIKAYQRFLNADWKSLLNDMKDDEISEYINQMAEGPQTENETDKSD